MSKNVVIVGRVCGAVLVATLLVPETAAAQRGGGPFAGLFGRTPPRTGQEITRVEMRSTLGGQYDGVIPRDALGPTGLPTGAVAAAGTGLAFVRLRDRIDIRAKAGAAYQEFFQEPRSGAPTYDAAFALQAKPGTRFTIDGNVRAVRSPFFRLSPANALSVPFVAMTAPGGGDAAARLSNDALDAEAGFTTRFAKRSSIGASVVRREIRFFEQTGRNYSAWGSRADFRYGVTKHASARLTYTRERSRQPQLGDGRYEQELYDVGLDMDRALSITRRTSFSFYTQTAVLKAPGGPRRFRLNGGATLDRDFNRTWNAALLVSRESELHPGFVAPLFSEGVTVTLGGMPTRRTEFVVNASARRGHVGFDGSNRINTQSGLARLSTGLTAKTGVYCEYSYYRYAMLPGASVVDMLPRLARQQLAIGVQMWLPVYTHVRAPRDPR